MLNIQYRTYDLMLRYPFRIALMTRTYTPLVLLEIEVEGITGYGEASMPPYLGETQETCIAFIEKVKKNNILKNIDIQNIDLEYFINEIDNLEPQNKAAKAAFDIALHDLKAKAEGIPLWQLLGSDPEKMPKTTCTLGIDTPSVLRKKAAEATDFDLLKIKLGSDSLVQDREIIETVRSVTDKPILVDANQGWKDPEAVLDFVAWLDTQNTLLVEQPFEKTNFEAAAWLSSRSPLPIFADESCQRLSDIPLVTGAFSGINIKLMKSTGLLEARKMITAARERVLPILIGCMSETSCAIMSAAALAPQCDFADLDGPWLTTNNPFETPILRGGKIVLTNRLGIGI